MFIMVVKGYPDRMTSQGNSSTIMVKLMRHANENEVVQVVQSLGLHRINKQYIIRQSAGYIYSTFCRLIKQRFMIS